MHGVSSNRRWAKVLEKVATELDIEFEFLIVFQKKFSSSFKASIGQIPIYFPNLQNSIVPLKDVVDVLRSSADHRSNFFHLFYKPKSNIDDTKKKQIVNSIARELIKTVSE